jgi:predicted dehydrogenase
VHLPTLDFLRNRFEVVALCDQSPAVVEAVAARFGIDGLLERDHESCIHNSNADVVLVATPEAFHTDVVLAALAAGKDVLAEKPLCLTIRDCDRILEACSKSGRLVQVGTMRRSANVLRRARSSLSEIGTIHHARVHDFVGHNALIVNQTSMWRARTT